jgi:hypothetical protein
MTCLVLAPLPLSVPPMPNAPVVESFSVEPIDSATDVINKAVADVRDASESCKVASMEVS